jgi:hypothetical protein
MCEIWKKIPGFSKCEASNFGVVRNIVTSYVYKPHLKNSYLALALIGDDKKRKGLLLHQIVAITFLPNLENKETVNHKDKNTLNNNLNNLEWATYLEQNIHKKLTIPKQQFSLASSRPVLLFDKTTNGLIRRFESVVLSCHYIYENNLDLFKNYDNFDIAKKTMKSRLAKILNNNLRNDEVIYDKYKIKYVIVVHQGEQWMPIPPDIIDGTLNCFVSSFGRVKNSKGRDTYGEIHTNGYMKTHLSKKSYSVHRILAKVFLPNPKNKTQVNHKDGNKLNNDINNLEWNTPSENCLHRSNLSTNTHLRKIIQFDLNRNKINEFTSIANASKILKLSCNSIHSCCKLKQIQTGGFIFRYIEDAGIVSEKKEKIRLIFQYDLNMEKINEFKSVSDASEKLSISRRFIVSCCNFKQKQSNGFIFMYADKIVIP